MNNHIVIRKENCYDIDFMLCNKNDAQILSSNKDGSIHSVVLTEIEHIEKIIEFFKGIKHLKENDLQGTPIIGMEGLL